MIAGAGELPLARRRLRWRARRGLLENDVILARFFERHGDQMTMDEMISFETLLERPENELLDLLLARCELPAALDIPDVREMLDRLRAS